MSFGGFLGSSVGSGPSALFGPVPGTVTLRGGFLAGLFGMFWFLTVLFARVFGVLGQLKFVCEVGGCPDGVGEHVYGPEGGIMPTEFGQLCWDGSGAGAYRGVVVPLRAVVGHC